LRDWMIVPRFGEVRQSHTPGRCAKCGTSDSKRRVLGSGIVLSQPGVVASLVGEIQFCDECVKAAARLVDMTDSAKVEAYKIEARDANLAKSRLERRVAKLETALESLKVLAE
jgi:hypothetical protein